MPKYKVRKGFCVYLQGELIEQAYPEDQEIELTDEQFERVKHQVEPVIVSKTKE